MEQRDTFAACIAAVLLVLPAAAVAIPELGLNSVH